ncbi:MAG: paraquat-inducible protein A [Magnetococcales bacterium]|nr:paraquat-inducible protein A [Magnetococcales bacterium]
MIAPTPADRPNPGVAATPPTSGPPGPAPGSEALPPVPSPRTALRLGLLVCPLCRAVLRSPTGDTNPGRCPRCQSSLHPRKVASLERTWALILTALILYIPANLLPIMTVTRFGRSETSTILNGIQTLITMGLWPLAAIVFFASVVVPLLKLSVLAGLAFAAGRHSTWRPEERARLYRLVESVGHWSMVDVFLVAILAAVVDLGAIAAIEPEAGATYFGAVVVVTLFAAHSFDPRLTWDPLGAEA